MSECGKQKLADIISRKINSYGIKKKNVIFIQINKHCFYNKNWGFAYRIFKSSSFLLRNLFFMYILVLFSVFKK